MAMIELTGIRNGLGRLAAALGVASLIAVAMTAETLANPVLRISNGGTTIDVADGSAADAEAAAGVIRYDPGYGNSPFDDWDTVIEIGTSLLLTDPDRVNQLINMVSQSNTASTLTISISENDLLVPGGISTALGNLGLTTLETMSSATMELFVDTGNTLFAETSPLLSLSGSGTAYNADAQAYFESITGPFSMTLRVTLEHHGAGLTTGAGANATVLPEPMTTALLGLGLLGLGLTRRRAR